MCLMQTSWYSPGAILRSTAWVKGQPGHPRCFHLRIWLGDQNGRILPSIDSGPPVPQLSMNVIS